MLKNRTKKNIRKKIKLLLYFFISYFLPSFHHLIFIINIKILKSEFKNLSNVNYFSNRNIMWNNFLSKIKNDKIFFIEFGVFKGNSIKYFIENNKNNNSRFFGFDSFEGLPEDWRSNFKLYKKEYYNLNKKIPKINDSRVEFKVGWFNNTLQNFLKELKKKPENLVIHYDADLYSSTLFCLTTIHSLGINYTAIFDQFNGDECRAFYDYYKSYNIKYKVTHYSGYSKYYPEQVILKIIHNN